MSSLNESADATVDPNRDLVTVLEVDSRLLDEAYSLGRTSHDDRPREKSCALGQECDCLANCEDLVAVRWISVSLGSGYNEASRRTMCFHLEAPYR